MSAPTQARRRGRPVGGGDSVATRARILVAANEVFRRDGYRCTTVKAIGDAADVSRQLVFHHFPGGKARLFKVLLDGGVIDPKAVHRGEAGRDAVALAADLEALR